MIEIAVATLVLAAISDQEEGTGRSGSGPMAAAVPISSLSAHSLRSLSAKDHVLQVREEWINEEIRRAQRLIHSHAKHIERLREERRGLR
jgi:hypothetical protein